MGITVHKALKSIADHDYDLARCQNGVGFSGRDSEFGNKLADFERLSPKQELWAGKLVRKYREQVAVNFNVAPGLKGKARKAAIENFLWSLEWQYQNPQPVAPQRTIKAVLGQNSGKLKGFAVRFPYDQALVETLKAKVPYRTFDRSNPKDPKWLVQGVAANSAGLNYLVNECGFVVSEVAFEALWDLLQEKRAA